MQTKSQDPIQFDEFDCYAHFGRYEGSREAPAPRHVFLVGRSRERAHFLDLLYMKSGLGSYLVTGVRGVGKSSFVRHCLDTYERDVYERYCRSAVGRSTIDKVCVFIAFMLPFLAVMTLLPLLSERWHSETHFSPITGTVFVALTAAVGLGGMSPLLYGCRRDAMFAFDHEARGRAWAARMLLGATVALFVRWSPPEFGVLPLAGLLGVLGVALWLGARWAFQEPPRDGLQNRPENVQKVLVAATWLARMRIALLALISSAVLASVVQVFVKPGAGGAVRWWMELLGAAACAFPLPQLLRLEKLWLLQPARRMVFETAIHPLVDPSGSTRNAAVMSDRVAWAVEGTLFYVLFRRWLPILRVSVNLGLDRLTHSQIVESMLLGLQEQLTCAFKKTFGVLNLVQVGTAAVVWLFVMHLPQPNVLSWVKRSGMVQLRVPQAKDPRAPAMNAPTHAANAPTPAASARTLAASAAAQQLTPQAVVPAAATRPSTSPPPILRLADFVVPRHRVDLVWGSLLGVLLLLASRRLVWLPHHRASREIASLLESLSSRVTIENATAQGSWKAGGEAVQLSAPTNKRTVETDPRDPRSLERSFLAVLSAIRKPTAKLWPGIMLSLPAPETIFVFDELDKVGTTTTLLDPDPETSEGYLGDERERSRMLQALLSDLKNLLGTAQGRFIFVGGRNLHDEWLADEVNRQPLLSNIFDAEIYLRSLLTDYEPDQDSIFGFAPPRCMSEPHPRPTDDTLRSTRSMAVSNLQGGSPPTALSVSRHVHENDETLLPATCPTVNPLASTCFDWRCALVPKAERMSVFTRSVRSYFEAQHWRAEQTWIQWRESAGAGRRDAALRLLAPTFQRGRTRDDRGSQGQFPLLRSLNNNEPLELDRFGDSFIRFLTFRSRGIPRRARLILETFIRPYDRVANLNRVERDERDAQHVLYFDDRDRVRIELVSELYQAIEGVPSALEWRDDKVLMAVFQFADFLTRFHRRAFSLQSLERFEELMHVHRAPDTSLLAAQLIADWLGSLLETTASGIHTYRFRLEWAAEIANLSRASQHESASANFTLDETQALKAQLRALLADEKGEGGAFEVHTALAELHDLDGDHLEARHQFRRAIEILDGRLKQEFAIGGGSDVGPVARVLSPKNSLESTERQLDWALARVRIMLQLGLTYERTFDYERAGLEYGNALQVARAIWRSKSELLPTLKSSSTALLEPIFAQAWAALKDPVSTESPFVAARDWLSELLLKDKDRAFFPEARWKMLTGASDGLATWSRELNMLGDLAFFSVPRWKGDLENAVGAYRMAQGVALRKGEAEHEQRARSLFSLALCSLMEHQKKEVLDFTLLREFAEHLQEAQQLAVLAPSSQGPFADSMAIHHLGLEIIEELWHICRAVRQDPERLRFAVAQLFVQPSSEVSLSPLRLRMLSDARWRLRAMQPEWETLRPEIAAFPTRNRFLNFRSELVESDFAQVGFERLLRMWRRFDSRSTLAPCRIAVAAPAGSAAAKIVWDESADISVAGKRYFAWLRDRYYLDDGFGPMLLRANFAITVGFSGVHRVMATGQPSGRHGATLA